MHSSFLIYHPKEVESVPNVEGTVEKDDDSQPNPPKTSKKNI